jgi:Acetyltransferases, including N-acetylases of ribosomal proteins
MIILPEQEYTIAIDLLNKVRFNKLFALAVIEGRVKGRVYADNLKNPKTFYIVHPYGMSLLLGDCHNQEFNLRFKDYALSSIGTARIKTEWMQSFPQDWATVLSELFNGSLMASSKNSKNEEAGIIELNTRVNFKFNKSKYLERRVNYDEYKMVVVDDIIFHEMKGSVVPAAFWNCASDFLAVGAGYSLIIDNEIASTAFSSFVQGNQFELGIETLEKFRGKGLAQYACSALIDYCIEKNLEPLWACRLENTGSYVLAKKLGFEPSIEIPYYRLAK